MARRSHYRVFSRLDMASRFIPGTVTITRGPAGMQSTLFSVRPYRRRKIYTLPLNTVADLVVQALVRAELAEKRKNKRRSRT